MASQAEIEQLEAKIEAHRTSLEPAVDEFIAAVSRFAARRYREDARHAVTKMPELAKQKGQAELAPLKVEVAELEASAPELARKHLDRDGLWKHRVEPADLGDDRLNRWGSGGAYEYRFSGRAAPKLLDEPVRQLIGEIAGPLERHGFLGDDEAEWRRTGDGYRYRYGLDWSDEMEAALARYADLFDELWRLHTELKRARAELESQQAGDLWDDV